ncbi:MAG TPA: glycosyltransferase family 2 protein [Acidimicrobiales bacterium]|nr:glycosyltransferase family 2 protein [Acidimicrobiales bacterium]
MARQRVLLAILVYNGRSFVPACLESAAGARVGHRDVDVLVLDDCSSEEGWSDDLRALCDSYDFGYYRSPRNIGIPRNMNLALGRAVAGGYDYVFVLNSDIVMPINLVSAMIRVAESTAGVGSVTAWSNNVSVYSIPNDDTTGRLKRQDMVDWLSLELEREFGASAVDIPTGVGFCLLIPVPVIAKVGLFDPVYGRGYCEEVDWCLRSRARGFRAVLAPSTFVFHQGSASTMGAGMLAHEAANTVVEHEHIIDLRYPWYRADVEAFLASAPFRQALDRAVLTIITHGAARFGYEVEATWVPSPPEGECAHLVVDPEGRDLWAALEFCGFRMRADIHEGDVAAMLARGFGYPPQRIVAHDSGLFVDQLVAAYRATVPIDTRFRYPQRV